MIGVWQVRRASMRPGCTGLFVGLILLITAHLAGEVHAASFAGAHVTVEITVEARPRTDTGHHSAPAPEHQHGAKGHIDHAVDRPRTSAGITIAESGHADPLGNSPGSVAALSPRPARGRPYDIAAPSADTSAVLALHCVWRL
ncbi:hypothetical protein AB0G54_29735 [Streptomyces yokosukanensis]|uniref:hypothetical protein n=1 Tax=Streptomyces yokosukanensis TaxID=67386 RepID=UPI0034300511